MTQYVDWSFATSTGARLAPSGPDVSAAEAVPGPLPAPAEWPTGAPGVTVGTTAADTAERSAASSPSISAASS